MNSEYSIAYSEVLIILKHMNKELVSKIPQKLLDFFNKEADSNHTLSLDYSIPFSFNIPMAASKTCGATNPTPSV